MGKGKYNTDIFLGMQPLRYAGVTCTFSGEILMGNNTGPARVKYPEIELRNNALHCKGNQMQSIKVGINLLALTLPLCEVALKYFYRTS